MLCEFVLTLYKLLVKSKKTVLEKHASREVLSFSEHFIYKEKSGASKTKSGTQNSTSMICESSISELFIFLLALYFYCGDKK